ncbi:ATP-binding protein [Herbidospora cretacea]|uniref:ATP-binding protein n=1 Tax=Herbidospora cretacea TaxID=28444 RepID=UPI00068DFD47|nr:tetratricopeptide repeat protein [Herbidospora cretacea]
MNPPEASGEAAVHNEITNGVFFSAVIQGRDITVQLPPQITPALSGMPAGSPAFTGRDLDLRDVLDVLAPVGTTDGSVPSTAVSSAAVVVTAVGGMGGVGKTELAIQAARTALDCGWFPGGVLFVDLFGYDKARRVEPGEALGGLLHALAIPGDHIPSDTEDRARLYASVLAAYAAAGRRVLVVIDNVCSAEQARPLLPTDGSSKAIVTSRHTLGMLGARLLDLKVLAEAEAVALLTRAVDIARPGDTRVSDHPEEAAELAHLCGYLPLALQIIAALLAENPVRPLSTMIEELADESSRLDEMEYGEVAVRAAFELSYRHLAAQEARVFRLLPVNPGPDVSTQAAAVLTGLEAVPARRLLERLARAHLIEHGLGYGRWRMHDLVRLFAEEHGRADAAADGRADALTVLLVHYHSTATAACHHLAATDRDAAKGGFGGRGDALTWLDAERANLVAATHTAAGHDPHRAIARDLPIRLGPFLQLRRHFDDWVALTTAALDAARELGDRRGEARASGDLGLAFRYSRRFDESISAHREAARIWRELGDRGGEARALSNLGLALQEVRRFDDAVAANQESLNIQRELGDRSGEARSLGTYGNALVLKRQFDEAVNVYRKARDIFHAMGDQSMEAAILANLGVALHELRRLDEVAVTYQDALRIYRELEDRHGQARTLTNLGHLLLEEQQLNLNDAVTNLQDALVLFRELEDRHGEARALNNLGLALQGLGQPNVAVTVHQQAVNAFRELEDRHGEAQALCNIGRSLLELMRFDEAIPHLRSALDLFAKIEDRHGAAQVLINQGVALTGLRRFDEAVAAIEEARDVFRELGDQHREAIALTNLEEIRRHR